MKVLCLAAIVASATAFSTADPELCEKVTCDTVAAHQCFWKGRHYSGAQNTLGMAFGGVGTGKNADAGADTCAGNMIGNSLNFCHGTVNYRGTNTKGVGCVGSQHRSMRVHHHNKEVNCATKFLTTGQERTNGAVCGIGMVTGSAKCECRPKCGPLYHYVDGTCRLKSANYVADTSICRCSNGTPRSAGCYSHADSCQACNPGYGLHRVSTLTTTGWECTKLEGAAGAAGLGSSRQIAGASPCTSDNQYQTSATECATCASTKYTTGGTFGHRTGCRACPRGKVCDGTSRMTPCPSGHSCHDGIATACGLGQYANSGASSCVTCGAGEYIATSGNRKYCKGCDAGHACNNGAKTACAAGFYAPQGAAMCFACETGTYAGQVGAARCKRCAAGSYTDGKVCTACPPGSYCPAKSTSPTTCPSDRYAGVGSAVCHECSLGVIVDGAKCDACPADKVCHHGTASSCEAGQRVVANKCVACGKGMWARSATSQCTTCSTGEGPFCTACNRNEYLKGNECTTCPAGYSCNGITRTACQPGTVSDNGSACKVCSAPKYSANDQCETCPEGSYIRNNNCETCPAGYSCDGSGNRQRCAAGEFSGAGQKSCSLCDGDNKYSGPGASACSTCPVRRYTSGGTGGKGHTQCLSCIYNANGSASNIGYVCDGTSQLTKCAAEHKAQVVGVCHATAGNQAAPGAGHHGGGTCAEKTTEDTCSSPGGFTGCTWAEQTIHVIHYTSPLCVPEIRTTDITTETGCPVCQINGSKFLTVESTTSSWTDPGVVCTGGVKEQVSEELPKNDDGSLKAGRHVLQYYARSQDGKFSYGCGNQNTWTRIVTVKPFSYKTEAKLPPYTAAAVGTAVDSTCPGGSLANAYGCSASVSPKMGGYSQNQCNNGVDHMVGTPLPTGHKYMQIAMVCRQGGCGANLKKAEVRFSKTTACSGRCGTGTQQCQASFGTSSAARPSHTATYGPISAGTTWSTHGDACNGSCANMYIADAWLYYKTAECFEDSHCAAGTCTSNMCVV